MYAKDSSILDRREMLRVKLKNLAQEARLIRREERRTHGQLREELHLHRIGTVRWAARETGIAYGLIRGMTLERMEPKSFTPPDWGKIEAMLKKYGPKNMVLNTEKTQLVDVSTLPPAPAPTGLLAKPPLGQRVAAKLGLKAA